MFVVRLVNILLRCTMNLIAGKPERRARVAALEKAFAVLELFGPDAPELRIADIAARTGLNRSSAQRTAYTLVQAGYLRRNERTATLRLSHRTGNLAHVYLSSNQLIELVMPLLVELNAASGLSYDLWLRDGGEAITLARVPSPAASLTLAPIGQRVALNQTAAGRALLALLAESERENRLAPLPGRAQGVTEAGVLRERLRREAEAGFSFDTSLTGARQNMVAAAFRDGAGRPLAALSVSGFVEKAGQVEALGETVRAAACRLTELRITPGLRPANFEGKPERTRSLADEADHPLFIASIGKGLHLLQFFRPETPSLTLTELHRLTGFPIPTVQRLIDTLLFIGYLEKDVRQRTLHLSVRSLDLLFRFQMGSPLLKAVWPRLIRLREECGLRCSFCILDGLEIVHLLHVQSRPHMAFRTAYPGRRLPAVSSSGGRAMLSLLPEAEMDAILAESVIEPTTPHTVTDKQAVRAEILAARRRGHAFTDRQSIREEVNVSAAILDAKRRPLGAIVVSAPVRSWSVERLECEVVPLLMSHARSDFHVG